MRVFLVCRLVLWWTRVWLKMTFSFFVTCRRLRRKIVFGRASFPNWDFCFPFFRADSPRPLLQVLSGLKKTAGFNQEAVTVILRLVNAGHEDVGFSLLSTMVMPQSQSGEALSVGNFFIRQMVRARRVGSPADTH